MTPACLYYKLTYDLKGLGALNILKKKEFRFDSMSTHVGHFCQNSWYATRSSLKPAADVQ